MLRTQVRDSTAGEWFNWYSKGRWFAHPEQQATYVVPARWLANDSRILEAKLDGARTASSQTLACEGRILPELAEAEMAGMEAAEKVSDMVSPEARIEQADKLTSVVDAYPYLVDWDGPDDPENPRLWSSRRRGFTSFLIALLTFSVYIGGAIYTSAIPSLEQSFGASRVLATAGLTSFVSGYGIGAMLFSPLQEMPSIGRTPVYIATLFFFIISQIPTVTATNMTQIIVFRFITGFFGSPALATGGASIGDLYGQKTKPYMIAVWCMGGVAGPCLGPVIGGFAAMRYDWRWPLYELLFLSSVSLVVLTFLLPETYGATVLHKRAQRLRAVTGISQLRTKAELLKKEGETVTQEVLEQCRMAIVIAAEPVMMFANIYTGLVYAIFYLWFEAFPVVFTDIYHFNLGLSGLPFLGFIVTSVFAYCIYCAYQYYYMIPRILAAQAIGRELVPEARLELAVVASLIIPASLFIFGWGARVHWIVPIIGAALYLPGIFFLFQCLFLYITLCYPNQEASVLAGNDMFRSVFASIFPLFGTVFFDKLGLGPGCSLLAGLSLLMTPLCYLLLRTGKSLRQRSKYAVVGLEVARKSKVASA